MRRGDLRAAAALLVGAAVLVGGRGGGGRAAWAHQSSVVYSDIVVRGRDVDYTFQIGNADLYEAVGVERDRPVTRDEVSRARDRLLGYLVAHVHVDAGTGAAPCPGEPGGLTYLDNAAGFFAVARVTYHCPRAIERARVRYDLFFDVDPRHEGIARVSFADEGGDGGGGAREREQVFRDGVRTLELSRSLGVLDHVRDYLELGVEHIFTGYDHLAFLFGLIIVAAAAGLRGGARKVLGVVTAFTVAHSVTLIASALGWVAPPSRLVEPAIALSIFYVAVENLVIREPRWRWVVTFAFGLVHGFGFASVLREIGLPERGLLLSLVSFNVGVEIGQLAVVATVLPLLALVGDRRASTRLVAAATAVGVTALFVLLRHFGAATPQLAVVCFGAGPLLVACGRRAGYDRVVRIGGSSVIAALAVLWFVERVSGRMLAGGWLG